MKIIDYFHSDDQPHWLAAIAENEWRAAKYLARLLSAGEFHREVGKGTVYLLTEGDKLVSFLTLAERDCISAPEYAPWIGFVHTAPEYRGHRHSGKLIEHACAVAREHGAQRVYLSTDHIGLYEKYGFTYLENRVSIYGEDSRVYVREAEGMPIEIKRMTPDSFRTDSLDGFIRHQEVTECWRYAAGKWQLVPIAFTEDWDHMRLRAEASGLLEAIQRGFPVWGAFENGWVVGYARLGECLGKRKQYIELVGFQVSAPYRNQGIGRRLFDAVCTAARERGAKKLYISAHSSKESQAAYHALGCVLAQEPDPAHVAAEPFDVQMEYVL